MAFEDDLRIAWSNPHKFALFSSLNVALQAWVKEDGVLRSSSKYCINHWFGCLYTFISHDSLSKVSNRNCSPVCFKNNMIHVLKTRNVSHSNTQALHIRQ